MQKKCNFSTNYTYPDSDGAFVCPVLTKESYSGAKTKNRMVSTMAANGVDYASISEQKSVNGGAYRTLTKTDFTYDEHGNETRGRVYPSYDTDGEKEVIQNDYTFNALGQQTQTKVTLTSAKNPSDNRSYVEEKTTYDSFGNELSYTDENGETVANFYMTGKGSELLSGSKNFYDDLGNEIGSAEFMNGELDKAHCTSFRFSKSETEVTGEEDEAQTITTGYEKEINPSSYTEEVDPANFYDQFNDSVLSETITKTVTDAEGSTLSQTTSYLRGKNKTETVTTYENDDFGRTVKENTIQKKYQDGRWLPSYETEVSYTYDENGNVTETETKSRKEGETDWQTQKTKAVYDSKGQVTKEYSPRGVKENVAAAYTYDLLGRKVKEELPQNKTDGSAGYQTVVNEYDKSGNLVETKEQIEGDKNKEIEYTYDKQGNLVQVKSSLENEKAQYVQYVYDEQGNKVRQFTGMTGPLTVTAAAVENAKDDAGKDTFTYGGKTYAVLVTGKKKSDTIWETKYVYDTKNRLVSYIDPEGRTEIF